MREESFPIAGFRPSNLGISQRKHLRHERRMAAFVVLIERAIKPSVRLTNSSIQLFVFSITAPSLLSL